MKRSISSILMILFILILLTSQNVFTQSTGNLVGQVVDGYDGSTLMGTNIFIQRTSIGTTTNEDGKFRIVGLQPTKFKVIFSYLGYEDDTVEVEIVAGRTLNLDITLSPQIIKGEEVVVTAQLQGQAAAINQQISSNTIVNVVSKDKIQELPDANAAESVGRLPGVSVQRDAGEGTKVVVRGLAPKFNSITVNGEKIPATDPEDRSVDLSMISSDILEGIEVFKALTPDKDADAIGGTINFVTKKAPENFHANVQFQSGYNNHENDYGNYRGSFSASDRFFDNKLGVLATANLQKANRSSDILDAGYNFLREENNVAVIAINNLNLGDRIETRYRMGGSVSLDYSLDNGDIRFSSLYSRTERDEIRRRKRYRIGGSYVEYWLRNRQINTDLYSNSFNGTYNLSFVDIDYGASYSISKQNTPRSHDSQFRELGAFTGDLIEDQGPKLIPEGAKNNLDETFFKQDFIDNEKINDRDFTANINLQFPFQVGDFAAGFLKIGGKYRNKKRERDENQLFTLAFAINELGAANPDLFDVTREGKIKISNFYDNSFQVKNFLEGAYEFGPSLDPAKLDNFASNYPGIYLNNGEYDLGDYNAGEAIAAGYAMAQVNIGQNFMILPGFRYENTSIDYSSVLGRAAVAENGTVNIIGRKDTLGVRSYEEFFPMFHARYKFYPWLDLRLAVTKTLSRPNYFNLVPYENINHFEETVKRGNPLLKHTTAWNYDAFLSFYGNFGLFTIGGFYKTLTDIDYIRTSRITEPGNFLGYELTAPENGKGETIVKGIEVELQTNLTFLPSPFDGIIIYANYSKIYSETFYPFLKIGARNPLPPFNFTFIDTTRHGKMPGQPDDIANIALGYEKGPFSGRISMIYQGKALQTIGTREELDGYSNEFVRLDLIMTYKVLSGLKLIMNVNNLTNLPERAYIGSEKYPTLEEYFGWTADLGLKYTF